MFSNLSTSAIRLVSALLVLVCALILVAPLAVHGGLFPDTPIANALVFYGVTAGAYALLPFVRRGDVFMVAMWMVLGVGVAPCFVGEELSAPRMFADMGGVMMAAGPIYIARFRQVAQGDIRLHRRREVELGRLFPRFTDEGSADAEAEPL